MNRVFLIGNLTRDPEFNKTPNDVSICKFDIAVNRRFAKTNDEVDFFHIVTWRGQADNCQKFLQKGNKVAIVGSIAIRQYEAQDGTKKTAVDVTADEVQFLTPKTEQSPATKMTPVTTGEQPPFNTEPKLVQGTIDKVKGDEQLPF